METKVGKKRKGIAYQEGRLDRYCAQELALVIKEKRLEKNLSKKQLARLIDEDVQIVEGIEKGTYISDLGQLLNIAHNLDIDVANFCNEIDTNLTIFHGEKKRNNPQS